MPPPPLGYMLRVGGQLSAIAPPPHCPAMQANYVPLGRGWGNWQAKCDQNIAQTMPLQSLPSFSSIALFAELKMPASPCFPVRSIQHSTAIRATCGKCIIAHALSICSAWQETNLLDKPLTQTQTQSTHRSELKVSGWGSQLFQPQCTALVGVITAPLTLCSSCCMHGHYNKMTSKTISCDYQSDPSPSQRLRCKTVSCMYHGGSNLTVNKQCRTERKPSAL